MNDENPFRSPTAAAAEPGEADPLLAEKLRRVARYQRGVLLCILTQIGAITAQVALPVGMEASPSLGAVLLMISLATLAVGLASMILVFLLATSVYGPAVGIVLGLLGLVPCLGLLVLLVVNSRATSLLRRHGIRVGLLGAKL